MKIIGEDKQGYICTVTKEEIHKYMSKWENNNKIYIGDEFDLGKGYNFIREIQNMLKGHEDFLKQHQDVIRSINSGITFLTAMGATAND